MSEDYQHTFQVGDVVRCIKGNNYFSDGATGTICECCKDGTYYVLWETGNFKEGTGGKWYAMPAEIERIARTKDPLNMKLVPEGITMNPPSSDLSMLKRVDETYTEWIKRTESDDPSHYKTDGVECIDAIRAMLGKEGFIAYCRGTITKYNWRFGKKDDCDIEAKKAMVYQQWILDTLADKPLTKKP